MSEFGPTLDAISRHEADAAKADEDFRAQLDVVGKVISGIAMSEVEHDLHVENPALAKKTATTPEDIQLAADEYRTQLEAEIAQAVQTKKQSFMAQHAAVRARQELLQITGPEES